MKTLWKTYRWKVFFAVTLLFLLLQLVGEYIATTHLSGYVAFVAHTQYYTVIFNLLVVIAIAQIMQYFHERPLPIIIAYVYALLNTIFLVSAILIYGPTYRVPLIGEFLLLLYSVFGLLRVKALEISRYFKVIAGLNCLSILLTMTYSLFAGTDSFLRSGIVEAVYYIVLLLPYVLVLVILYRMMRLPGVPRSIQHDIDSIGDRRF